MYVHITSETGKRPTNEDEHLVVLNLCNQYPQLAQVDLFCVFDGHGGKEVSLFLKKYFYRYVMNINNTFPLDKKNICKIYNKLQDKLSRKLGKDAVDKGSTACVFIQFLLDGKLYIQALNLGDSRLVINANNIGFALTKDHKPDKIDEKKRIEKLGGKITREKNDVDWRIEGISVSRSFGDIAAKPYIDHIPESTIKEITKEDKFLILACDGLWDVVSPQESVDFVLERMKYNLKGKLVLKKDVNIAKLLAKYAIKNKRTTDNVTVIFVFLGN